MMKRSLNPDSVFRAAEVKLGRRFIASVGVKIAGGASLEFIADAELVADVEADGSDADSHGCPCYKAHDDATLKARFTRQNFHNKTCFPRLRGDCKGIGAAFAIIIAQFFRSTMTVVFIHVEVL